MANESMRLSEAGWAALRDREQAVIHYYNAQVNAQLAARVSTAESQVRRSVTQRELTQAQFDELVSYTYNAGNTGALAALQSANQNNDTGVVSHMNQRVYIHPRDAQGRRLRAIRSNGLVNRRRLESAPFQPQRTR